MFFHEPYPLLFAERVTLFFLSTPRGCLPSQECSGRSFSVFNLRRRVYGSNFHTIRTSRMDNHVASLKYAMRSVRCEVNGAERSRIAFVQIMGKERNRFQNGNIRCNTVSASSGFIAAGNPARHVLRRPFPACQPHVRREAHILFILHSPLFRHGPYGCAAGP
jgi:hypothetical protein